VTRRPLSICRHLRGVQEEPSEIGSEDEEYEDSAGGDAGQTEGNDNSFLQEEDA